MILFPLIVGVFALVLVLVVVSTRPSPSVPSFPFPPKVHPFGVGLECRWACDDPLCEGTCQPKCEAPVCPGVEGCTIHCPLEAEAGEECPRCVIACPGLTSAEVAAACQPTNCSWGDCEAPLHCPKPTCELLCSRPACEYTGDGSGLAFPFPGAPEDGANGTLVTEGDDPEPEEAPDSGGEGEGEGPAPEEAPVPGG